MKKVNIAYWTVTIIMSLLIGFGSVFNIMSHPDAVKAICGDLGFPEYIVPFVGVVKLLGIIAILIPGFPKIKEWAYAGLVFDLGAALYAHISSGFGPEVWAGLLLPIALVFASYFLYHKKEKPVLL